MRKQIPSIHHHEQQNSVQASCAPRAPSGRSSPSTPWRRNHLPPESERRFRTRNFRIEIATSTSIGIRVIAIPAPSALSSAPKVTGISASAASGTSPILHFGISSQAATEWFQHSPVRVAAPSSCATGKCRSGTRNHFGFLENSHDLRSPRAPRPSSRVRFAATLETANA